MNTAKEFFVIYDHPKECPDYYVVRLWRNCQPTEMTFLSPTLDGARRAIPRGRIPLARNPKDDPVIVETWV
jgi:hypothetical protein